MDANATTILILFTLSVCVNNLRQNSTSLKSECVSFFVFSEKRLFLIESLSRVLLDISMSTTILALRWFVLCARSEAWVVVWFCGGGDGVWSGWTHQDK